MRKIIEIKCIQPYYKEIEIKKKTFELRLDDRNYMLGDYIILREYITHDQTYTGNYLILQISYILKEFRGLKKDYCLFSFYILASGMATDVRRIKDFLKNLMW